MAKILKAMNDERLDAWYRYKQSGKLSDRLYYRRLLAKGREFAKDLLSINKLRSAGY